MTHPAIDPGHASLTELRRAPNTGAMSGPDLRDDRPITSPADRTQQLELAVRRAIAHLESLSSTSARAAALPLPSHIAGRRRQVAELAVQGASTETIALELGLSPNTVRNHLKAVCRALGLRSRAALVARYHA